MQNSNINLKNVFNSSEFKKRSTNVAQDTLKFSFRWIAVGLKSVYNFFVTMIKMGIGK